VKTLNVLCWKRAFTVYTVPWRLWDLTYTWYTASCCMLSGCLSLLRSIPYACLALLCCICSQMQEAALQLLWFWTPGWIQTICTALAHSWYSTGKKGSGPAPPRTSSFAFGGFVITTLTKRALTSSLALLWGAPSACLAPLGHISSQMQEAALQLLRFWTPGWIQTTCTILAHLWHSTGKEGPAAAPSGTASFAFCGYIVTILVKRAKTCPSGVPPSPRGAVVAPEVALDMHPAPAREMHCDDSSSDQHKRGVPDTESTDSDDSQEATKVGFAPVLLC